MKSLILKKNGSIKLAEYSQERKKVWIENYKPNKKTDDMLLKVERILRESGTAYGTLYQGYTSDKLKRFWNWLTEEFGIVAESNKNIYERIVKEIAQLFTADMSTIYTFNYPENILEYKAEYLQHKDKDFAQTLKDNMENAGKDKKLRRNAISYRCSEDKKPNFCRALLSDGTWDPPEERTLNPQKGLISRLSLLWLFP